MIIGVVDLVKDPVAKDLYQDPLPVVPSGNNLD